MGWALGAALIGALIVALAVGIPFYWTHRRMREPHDVSASQEYLHARRRWWLHRRRWTGRPPSVPEEPLPTTPSAPRVRRPSDPANN